MCFPSQNALAHLPPPFSKNLNCPLGQSKAPMASYDHPTKHIYHLHHKPQKGIPALLNCKKHRLDIVFEEYARYLTVPNHMRLFSDSVLVGEDGMPGVGSCTVNGIDSWDDGEEVLELVEVVRRCGDGAVEGVKQGGVESSERELRDNMREIEHYPASVPLHPKLVKGGQHTAVIQMLRSPFLVAVSSGSNMEITLHLIHIQTPKHPATIPSRRTILQPRRLPKLSPPSPRSRRNDIMHVLLPKPLLVLMIPLARNHPALRILPQTMHALGVHPLRPVRRVPLQHIRRQNAVPGRVLHVDVDILARHLEHDI